jgi:drug/metabolite transporter (DMT)-like permease
LKVIGRRSDSIGGIILWLGITGGTLFSALQYVGLQYTTALNVSIFNSLVPVLIIAAGALIFRDRIRLVQLLGISTSLIGVIVIVTRGAARRSIG